MTDSPPSRAPARRLRARPRPATDREERTQALRSAILESAIAEFAAHGYGGASLRAIAARTGIELGHLGYHFSTKLELWQAAVAAIFEAMPSPEAVPLPETAEQAVTSLSTLVRNYADFCVSHPEHIQIVFGESPAGGERLQWLSDNFLNPVVQGFNRHIEAARNLGIAGAVPPSLMIAALVGISAINFALPELRDTLRLDAISTESFAAMAQVFLAATAKPA
ncbi:TetR/AcrR family transcriptional regulator [Zavarzinia sp.]|uniref:TetR/AcrR family transcriptional regulator n=1 Tax=Zavarzinia sp. TaxID=2027920 RepID=UPI0035657412